MASPMMPIAQALPLLAEAPARIAALTTGLPPDRLRAAPGPGEWSATEVLAHLRACADVWGGCIDAIRAQEHPTLKAVDPRTWILSTNYPNLEFGPSLRAYTVQRAALMIVLGALSQAEWQRSATMIGSGRPIERTVHSFAQRMAKHERPHIKQIVRIAQALRG